MKLYIIIFLCCTCLFAYSQENILLSELLQNDKEFLNRSFNEMFMLANYDEQRIVTNITFLPADSRVKSLVGNFFVSYKNDHITKVDNVKYNNLTISFYYYYHNNNCYILHTIKDAEEESVILGNGIIIRETNLPSLVYLQFDDTAYQYTDNGISVNLDVKNISRTYLLNGRLETLAKGNWYCGELRLLTSIINREEKVLSLSHYVYSELPLIEQLTTNELAFFMKFQEIENQSPKLIQQINQNSKNMYYPIWLEDELSKY